MHIALLSKVSEQQPWICSEEEVQLLHGRLSALPTQQGERLFSWLLTCTSGKDGTVYTAVSAQLREICQTHRSIYPSIPAPAVSHEWMSKDE